MSSDLMSEIHEPTSAQWLPDLVSRLQCPDCGGADFELHRDESMPLDWTDSAAVVCNSCHACYPYARGILNFLPERPRRLTFAQRSNFNPIVARWYQTAWRSWSMTLLTGKTFSNEEEGRYVAGVALNGLGTHETWAGADLGTSHGLYAINLALDMRDRNVSGYVVGVDFSPLMLQQALIRASRSGVANRILWLLADVENLPLKDNSMAYVTDGGTLNEYSNERRALSETKRVLAVKGTYVAMHLFAENGVTSSMLKTIGLGSGLRFPSRDLWQQRFCEAGLSIRTQEKRGRILLTELQKNA